MKVRSPELVEAAQLLRRTSMRVDHSAVEELAGRSRDDMLDQVLVPFIDTEPVPESDEAEEALIWWARKMVGPQSGIHERMTFFWHNILTSHRYATGNQALVARQLQTLRSNALGNFRDLLFSFVTDANLLIYLNADASTAETPNENLSREIMELFSLGVGNYTEADVKAGALAMAGWTVDRDNDWTVEFVRERAHNGPVTYLGEERVWDMDQVVDRLAYDPISATRIAGKIWDYFIGVDQTPEQRRELGTWWITQDLEILPLLERVLRDPAMTGLEYARPRSGFEAYAAFASATNLTPDTTWRPRQMGQALYEPPNVAGWPNDLWLSPDSMLRRLNNIGSIDYSNVDGALEASADDILDRCGIYAAEQTTFDAIESPQLTDDFSDEDIANIRWRVALACPEFQLV